MEAIAMPEELLDLPRYTPVATATEETPLSLPRYIIVPRCLRALEYADLDLPLTRHPDHDPHPHFDYRPHQRYPYPIYASPAERKAAIRDVKCQIFARFWGAIRADDVDRIIEMVSKGLISPCALDHQDSTPLVSAISYSVISTVRHLARLGADVNQFGVVGWERVTRTPLQVAAAHGNFLAVRLLVEEYGADDALVAPDGQIALRLAAEGGYKEIVEYLPLRRDGGLRRWKAQHAKAMRRARKAGKKIAKYFKIILFDVPFHLFIYAPCKIGHFFWKHKEGIAYMSAKLVTKTPVYAFRMVKALPRVITDVVGWLWRALKAAPKRIWRVARILGAWLAKAVLRLGSAVATVFERLFSVLHTVVAAMFRFMRDITFKDVWNGFRMLVRAVFVGLPVAVLNGIVGLGEASYQVLKAMLGVFGMAAYWTLFVLVHIILYVPWQIGRVAIVFGKSVAKGFREVMVWYDPKRAW